MKKAEGLSLTTVVIAAVALVVLVVLILIFSGRINLFNKGATSCPPGSFEAHPSVQGAEVPNCNPGDLPVKVIGNKDDVIYCCPNCGDSNGYCHGDPCDKEQGFCPT